ncbi:MAG: cysteine hydrolase family protein [Acidobacteriota bacterium]
MKTVFVDVDTQLDFLYPAGALYVPGAGRLLPALARLTRHAAGRGIPVVATMDAHAENDPEFTRWPPHCVAGTHGQQKAAQTLFDGQIRVEKRHIDVFRDSRLQEVVDQLAADRWVVYGVVTEYCVATAAMGLLRTGKPVEIVTDAIAAIDEAEARRTFEEFTARGGRFTTVEEVCARS